MSLKQLIRFINDAGTLEKILRLLQSLSQIIAAYSLTSEDATTWLLLRRQFALGRRYIRFFRWMDCFSKAYDVFVEERGLVVVLGVGKWSCMGAFLGLESLTVLDIMGVWQTDWAKKCLVEANRFWFYALVFSLLWEVVQLFSVRDIGGDVKPIQREKGNDESSSEEAIPARRRAEVEKRHKRAGITRRLVVDGLDLLIPGHVVGWIVTSSATTGVAGSISTVLSMKDIWDKLR